MRHGDGKAKDPESSCGVTWRRSNPGKATRIREIGEDYILGRKVDELGVESIQLWRLERSGG